MKIIVSSKSLARSLNSLPGHVDSIQSLGTGENTEVRFCADERYSPLHCISRDSKKIIDQAHRHWELIKELVNKVDDQPITLDITEERVNVTFSF